ncbi:fimbrial protein [Ursidibacter arcticus]
MKNKIYAGLAFIIALYGGEVWAYCLDSNRNTDDTSSRIVMCRQEWDIPVKEVVIDTPRDVVRKTMGNNRFERASPRGFKFFPRNGPIPAGMELTMLLEKVGSEGDFGIYKLNDDIGIILVAGDRGPVTSEIMSSRISVDMGQTQILKFRNGSTYFTGSDSLGFAVRIYPVLLKPTIKGNFVGFDGRKKIATAKLITPNNSVEIVGEPYIDVYLSSFSVRSELKTCELNPKNIELRFPTVSKNSFPNIGSLVYGASTNILLDCSKTGQNVFVRATLTDHNDINNTSDTLKIERGANTAEGIGIKLFKDNDTNALAYSPVSLEIGGNKGVFDVSKTRGELYPSMKLTGYYIRTGNITPGDVRAQATITFSYQ